MKAARNKLKENNSAIEKLTDIIAKTESVFESLMFDPVELRWVLTI